MPSLRKGGGLIARARPGRISMYELRVPKAFHGKYLLPSADFLFLFRVHITKRREFPDCRVRDVNTIPTILAAPKCRPFPFIIIRGVPTVAGTICRI